MGPIRKQDWGGRWTCLLKTEVLQHAAVILLQYIARFSEILYNPIFNTGVLHGQNVRH